MFWRPVTPQGKNGKKWAKMAFFKVNMVNNGHFPGKNGSKMALFKATMVKNGHFARTPDLIHICVSPPNDFFRTPDVLAPRNPTRQKWQKMGKNGTFQGKNGQKWAFSKQKWQKMCKLDAKLAFLALKWHFCAQKWHF